MTRPLADIERHIERRNRELADSPWGPTQTPQRPRARHLRVEDFETTGERVRRFVVRGLLIVAFGLALCAAIALVETALRL